MELIRKTWMGMMLHVKINTKDPDGSHGDWSHRVYIYISGGRHFV